jgi:hypothetical protein
MSDFILQNVPGGGGGAAWNTLRNATGNLSLSNAGFTSTFNQTSAVAWLWANTTLATAITVNASPLLELAANYYTGSTSAQDTWTIGSSLAAGTNGVSTLALAHSGSTGAALVTANAFRGTQSPGSSSFCTFQLTGVNTGFFGAGGGNGLLCATGGTVVWEAITGSPSSGTMIPAATVLGWALNVSAYMDIAFTRTTSGLLSLGNGNLGNVDAALVLTGEKNYGGLQLLQAPSVVGTVTVTPTGGSATAYSYEVVALDINLQPIGVSAAGSTSTGVATLTTSAFNTVSWADVQGAFAYAVYRSASSGTPATTGLLYGTTAVTSVTAVAGGSSTPPTAQYAYSSTAINAKLVGQLVTVEGCANAANNGTFYCSAATATIATLQNPYAVTEASSPASATLQSGIVLAGVNRSNNAAPTFVDYGWSANGLAAPTANTHGSLSFVSSFESSATGPALSQDTWNIYPSVASGLNGASTLTVVHGGSTGTAAVSLTNPTIATSGTTNASPLFDFVANYWTGSASAVDTWTIGSSLAAGTNGNSTLTLVHSGSTGQAQVLFPPGTSTFPSVAVSATQGMAQQNVNNLQLIAGVAGSYINFGTTSSPGCLGFQCSALAPSIQSLTGGSFLSLYGNTNGQANQSAVVLTNSASFTGTATPNGIVNIQGTYAATTGTFPFFGLSVTPTINQSGAGAGTIRVIAGYAINTALTGTEYLLALGTTTAAGVGGTLTDKFLIDSTGAVKNYGGTATTNSGVASIVASSKVTGKTTAIAATTIYAVPASGAGMYRVAYAAWITTKAVASSVLGGAAGFQTVNTTGGTTGITDSPTTPVISSGNSVTTKISGDLYCQCDASTNLQYQFGYTDSTNVMTYSLNVYVEYLG